MMNLRRRGMKGVSSLPPDRTMPKKKLISEAAARIKIHKTRFTPAEDAQIRKLAAAAGRPVPDRRHR
jgi:hypothetical protein